MAAGVGWGSFWPWVGTVLMECWAWAISVAMMWGVASFVPHLSARHGLRDCHGLIKALPCTEGLPRAWG